MEFLTSYLCVQLFVRCVGVDIRVGVHLALE